MQISYETYYDKILGGWIGKSVGGTIGDRFEGNKNWIEVDRNHLFPEQVPPNDDLDLQILWLKVLEEKGAALESADLANAWLEGCWYPFCEYGMLRRNWRLGIHPPYSGRLANQHWENGMGCPIRSEIWGYVFPGAPDLAAGYAWKDGTLDHSAQSAGAEQMLSAMAAMAFFETDIHSLSERYIHYLPEGSFIKRSVRSALDAYEEGLDLREARERILLTGGHPEACDAQVNVPFIFLALLYGENNLEKTLLSALSCGYDTDCTMATATALLGQIMGAHNFPAHLREPIGDHLVMGIEYHRPEMTLSALARDTARVGVLLAEECQTGVTIQGAPAFRPFPASAVKAVPSFKVDYLDLPSAAPGDNRRIRVQVEGAPSSETPLLIEPPSGWTVFPAETWISLQSPSAEFTLQADPEADTWPQKHLFLLRLGGSRPAQTTFGIAGAGLWRLLGVFFDAKDPRKEGNKWQRAMNHHFVSLDKEYLPELDVDADVHWRRLSHILGRPAVIASYEREIALDQLIGLRGQYCAYLNRTVYSEIEEKVFIVIGNTDAFRLFLNGELVGQSEERIWWTPFNTVLSATLKEGRNDLLLKLLKRGDDFRFTLDFRPARGPKQEMGHHFVDWHVDLKDQAWPLSTCNSVDGLAPASHTMVWCPIVAKS